MGYEPNLLFPYVLDILSTQPMFSETQDNVLKTIKENLKSEGIKVRNLKKEMETTLDVGKNLGILTVHGDKIRMPSLLKSEDVLGSTETDKTHSSRSSSRRGRRRSHKRMNSSGSRKSRSRSHRRSRSRRYSKRS